jgi:DNA-binding IclR family transcriptional regulator
MEVSTSVTKALRILEILASRQLQVGVTEISKGTGLNISTAHRLLHTLVAADYVTQLPAGKYRIGPKVLQLARGMLEHQDLPTAADPIMRQLATETGETIHLLVPDGSHGIYIRRIDSTQRLRVFSPIGLREPLHFSAAGKAIMAFLPEPAREGILAEGLERKTATTITDSRRLREELSRVRVDSIAFDDEEGMEGTRCIGAPIFDHGGVIAGLSIAGPSSRVTLQVLMQYAGLIRRAAGELSALCGGGRRSGPAVGQGESPRRGS